VFQLDPSEVRFFCGNSNPALAGSITELLGIPLSPTTISRFSNDDLYIQLGKSVRSREVFLLQSLSAPVNDHLMELLMMIDIAKSAGAGRINTIIPYFSFARSDKKDAPRISITARLVADLLYTAGATQVMTMMLHSPQVHGFFRVPTDPLTARFIFQRYFSQQDLSDTIVVAPDVGGAKSAGRFAKELGLPVASGYKERISDDKVVISGLVGWVVHRYKKAIVYDDEIATGSSIEEINNILVANGIESLSVVCTHAVFSRNALARLTAIPTIREIVTTDTVAIPQEKIDAIGSAEQREKLKVLSVASVFAEAIYQNCNRGSLGPLFEYGRQDDEP
jgi:ribose-phosphate pyrophosphokinase